MVHMPALDSYQAVSANLLFNHCPIHFIKSENNNDIY